LGLRKIPIDDLLCASKLNKVPSKIIAAMLPLVKGDYH